MPLIISWSGGLRVIFRDNNDRDDSLTDLRKILPETLTHCESVCSKRGKNRRRDGAWTVT